jgi:hypothetical protein
MLIISSTSSITQRTKCRISSDGLLPPKNVCQKRPDSVVRNPIDRASSTTSPNNEPGALYSWNCCMLSWNICSLLAEATRYYVVQLALTMHSAFEEVEDNWSSACKHLSRRRQSFSRYFRRIHCNSRQGLLGQVELLKKHYFLSLCLSCVIRSLSSDWLGLPVPWPLTYYV